jgi:hypothetical protein
VQARGQPPFPSAHKDKFQASGIAPAADRASEQKSAPTLTTQALPSIRYLSPPGHACSVRHYTARDGLFLAPRWPHGVVIKKPRPSDFHLPPLCARTSTICPSPTRSPRCRGSQLPCAPPLNNSIAFAALHQPNRKHPRYLGHDSQHRPRRPLSPWTLCLRGAPSSPSPGPVSVRFEVPAGARMTPPDTRRHTRWRQLFSPIIQCLSLPPASIRQS